MTKAVYVLAFICLGACSWFLVVKQSRQTSRSGTELRSEIKRLASESAEVTRLQASNSELQKQLLELAKLNTTLAK